MADKAVKDKKEKKQKKPGRARRWFKDFFSELKKVTWPSFAKVIKQTGVVLMVTIIFMLVLMAFDTVLGLMYDALVGGLVDGTNETETVRALGGLLGGGGALL